MKIVCLIKTTCPFNHEIGIAPGLFAPTVRRNVWADNYYKHSEQYLCLIGREELDKKINFNEILLFDSEEELNIWANNCRLTDPQLIADQEMWQTAHGITITYEYYSLSLITGPNPPL